MSKPKMTDSELVVAKELLHEAAGILSDLPDNAVISRFEVHVGGYLNSRQVAVDLPNGDAVTVIYHRAVRK